jgi:hypothetical protein
VFGLVAAEGSGVGYLIEWMLDLWATAWRADERLHGPSRKRWPWVVFWLGAALLLLVWGLENAGVLPG